MLATLKELMATAEEKKIAFGGFNAVGLETIEAEIESAEEMDSPVIIQFAQCHETLVSIKTIGPIMVAMAEKARVPVCIHLDHGENIDFIKKALDIGFSSVMYDCSTLTFEEKVSEVRKAVELASRYGASVEAELGSMGRRESGSGEERTGENDETKIYTDPDQAAEFVDATGIDALACSFGTTHGIYLKQPKLDFSVVRRVREKTGNIPVVMHGGSGVSPDDYRKAIEAGVRKINYFTYMDKAGGTSVLNYLNSLKKGEPVFFSSIMAEARRAIKEDVTKTAKIFALKD